MSIIRTASVRNFRCFDNETFDLSAPVVVISGENGSGKTSLLEALFYATGLRSFRTRSPRECIRWGCDSYAIAVAGAGTSENITDAEPWDLRVCVTRAGERMVKLNGTAIDAWHEATAQCRAIAISEEDLALVGGAPDDRRRFLDHAIALEDTDYLHALIVLKRVVRQKNALLTTGRCTFDACAAWTTQLDELSAQIRATRKSFLKKLQATMLTLATEHQISHRAAIELEYSSRDVSHSEDLFARECAMRRTLSGAHLDDIVIAFNGQPARQFASRGQQKLIAFLLKAGVISLLSKPALILVDDFMTDLDEKNAATLLTLAQKLGGQLMVTAPQAGYLPRVLLDQIALHIKLETKNMPYCKKECETVARQ